MALFLIGGCSRPETVWVYRWDILRDEMPGTESGRMILGPPALAADNIFGRDAIAGVNLNHRRQPNVSAGYRDQGETVQYYLRFHDRQGDGGGLWGSRYGGRYGDGYLRRSFSYYSAGAWRR